MNISEKDKKELIKYRVEKSRSTLQDVMFLINNDKLAMAVNRIYYSAYYVLSALALRKDFATSKHQQLIGWFNRDFVKGNVVDKKYGEFLVKAFENRSTGDYDDFVEFNKTDVLELFLGLKEFVDKIEGLINAA